MNRSTILGNRYWLTFLMVITLAMRLAVPSGWMPSIGADGTVITICTGTGLTDVTVDADGTIHKKSPHEKTKADGPCAFASVGAVLDGHAPAFALEPLARVTASVAQASARIGHGLAAPPPPSTGPPILI